MIDPSLIILAGFLLKMPEQIIDYFPQKIVNIHPSLLPKYGGKGMYGMNVHKKIIENKESKSGISIHYVNKYYDEGGNYYSENYRNNISNKCIKSFKRNSQA